MSTGGPNRKPVAWLYGEVKSPPFSLEARMEAGFLLGRVQEGEILGMPQSRPMPSIGPRCHELRIKDRQHEWRIIYRIDPGAILVVEVFAKTTQRTPKSVIDKCQRRLDENDENVRQAQKEVARQASPQGGTSKRKKK